MVGGEHYLNVLGSEFLRFVIEGAVKIFLERLSYSVNYSLIDKGVRRKALATLGLLNIYILEYTYENLVRPQSHLIKKDTIFFCFYFRILKFQNFIKKNTGKTS